MDHMAHCRILSHIFHQAYKWSFVMLLYGGVESMQLEA